MSSPIAEAFPPEAAAPPPEEPAEELCVCLTGLEVCSAGDGVLCWRAGEINRSI